MNNTKMKPFRPILPIAPEVPEESDLANLVPKFRTLFSLEELFDLLPDYVDRSKVRFCLNDGDYYGPVFSITYPDDERNAEYQRLLKIHQSQMIHYQKALKEFEDFEKEEAQKELELAEQKVKELRKKLEK